jgi:hypothetical protein
MSMPVPVYYSANIVRKLIDEVHAWPCYETVYGELLVRPAPRLWHQEVVARHLVALRESVHASAACRRSHPQPTSPGAIDTLAQPDVFVVPLDEARTLDWRVITPFHVSLTDLLCPL